VGLVEPLPQANMSPGQIIAAVVRHPLVKKIRDELQPDWEWTSGGCFAFAEATVKAWKKDGAELWVVGQFQEPTGDEWSWDWASQHAFVRLRRNFYDATGRVSKRYLLDNFSWESSSAKIGCVKTWDKNNKYPLWYPEQEFVEESEINLIAKLLTQGEKR